MDRINQKFKELERQKKKALIGFVSAFDPNYRISRKIINKLPSYGVDIIEIGLPFSDPMADGPTIQKSSLRGIKAGFNLNKTFDLIIEFRKDNAHTPIILMGYFNTLFQYGIKKFFLKSKTSGVDGVILVDLPPEEDGLILNYLKKTQIDIIRLLTPTTDKKRFKTIINIAGGFLYYVSVMGITGTKKPSIKDLEKRVRDIKKKTILPLVVGFGINEKKQVEEICKFADGIVVGSSIVKIIEGYSKKKYNESIMINKINKFVKSLSEGCFLKN
tara:strand:- start:2233 stop:3051 length:819 start_codon:yes stop_codon:yes gene_type:complete